MIRSALLLLCAALLAAVTFACVAPAIAPPPPPPELFPAVGSLKIAWPLTACNASNFAASVTILSTGFDPNAHPYVAPSGTVRPGSIIRGDLQEAFNNAPP